MRKIILKSSITILLLLFFGAGCNKEKEGTEECNYETSNTDPATLIMGNWELSEQWMGEKEGYKPIDKNDPGDILYLEFKPDSVVKFFDGKLNTNYLTYWVDTLLHYYHPYGYPETPWYYEFPDNCTLKLGSAFLALTPVNLIFKRIKQ